MAGSPCPVEVMKQVIDEMNMTKACVSITSMFICDYNF